MRYPVVQTSGTGGTGRDGVRPWYAVIIPRTVTATSTRAPPVTAHKPGASPVARKTHMGLIKGSMDGISTASSALTRLLAKDNTRSRPPAK